MRKNISCFVISFFIAVVWLLLSIVSFPNLGFDNLIGKIISSPMSIIFAAGYSGGDFVMFITGVIVFGVLWVILIFLYTLLKNLIEVVKTKV